MLEFSEQISANNSPLSYAKDMTSGPLSSTFIFVQKTFYNLLCHESQVSDNATDSLVL